ncbi:NAD-dependent epimerase/dehydratase family protein [Rhodocytophaga rosea]|uniref:NAD-dependent epimerase/dehydratase family protein n=1 Tax=Rhodocytophaga rosea TaxID=2704465 RepID=A0A6C0GPP0_9BACT|nr:NAD-dependent epimerase/dehydratase family protein [Rhodocytophaga rosea]QHT69552.1 NAD-dependent epimerase/dehydratase family protein [Rhodocytophaga rosea]
MNKLVLVTGANGHLGLNTVRSLLNKGYQVKAFVRKTSDLQGLANLPLSLSYGDIRDLVALTKAAEGCEVIIHHAAVYKTWARSPEEVMEPAIVGTRNIFAAAVHAGIQRLIYTSSTYAIGTTTNAQTILTSKDWNQNENVPYGIAKTKSEQLAWELADQHNIPMISFCPGAIFGRYDYRVTPSNRMVLDMIRGMGMTVEGILATVDVRDVGNIHALAVEKGTIGERYIVTGQNHSMKEVGSIVNRLTHNIVPHMPFGRSINIGMAGMMEMVAKLSGWTPPFTVGMAKEYSHRYAQFDNSKTIKDFNYRFYTLEETIADTIKWFMFLHNIKLSKEVADQFKPENEWLEMKNKVSQQQPV